MQRKCVIYNQVTIYLLEVKFILWNKFVLFLALIISYRVPPYAQNFEI